MTSAESQNVLGNGEIWTHPKPRQGGFAPWTPNPYHLSCFCTRAITRQRRQSSLSRKPPKRKSLYHLPYFKVTVSSINTYSLQLLSWHLVQHQKRMHCSGELRLLLP